VTANGTARIFQCSLCDTKLQQRQVSCQANPNWWLQHIRI